MEGQRKYGGLDWFRVIAAALVTAIHTSPLASLGEGADFFLTRVLARVAVPFFFMVTGQFVLADCLGWRGEGGMEGIPQKVRRYVGKLAVLYGISILLYLPVGIYAGHYKEAGAGGLLRMLVFDGTFYHLWYFPACITGVLLVYGLSRILSFRGVTAAAGILYVIGLFGDSYFGIIRDVPVVSEIYGFGFHIFSYTRNGIFLAISPSQEEPADRYFPTPATGFFWHPFFWFWGRGWRGRGLREECVWRKGSSLRKECAWRKGSSLRKECVWRKGSSLREKCLLRAGCSLRKTGQAACGFVSAVWGFHFF